MSLPHHLPTPSPYTPIRSYFDDFEDELLVSAENIKPGVADAEKKLAKEKEILAKERDRLLAKGKGLIHKVKEVEHEQIELVALKKSLEEREKALVEREQSVLVNEKLAVEKLEQFLAMKESLEEKDEATRKVVAEYDAVIAEYKRKIDAGEQQRTDVLSRQLAFGIFERWLEAKVKRLEDRMILLEGSDASAEPQAPYPKTDIHRRIHKHSHLLNRLAGVISIVDQRSQVLQEIKYQIVSKIVKVQEGHESALKKLEEVEASASKEMAELRAETKEIQAEQQRLKISFKTRPSATIAAIHLALLFACLITDYDAIMWLDFMHWKCSTVAGSIVSLISAYLWTRPLGFIIHTSVVSSQVFGSRVGRAVEAFLRFDYLVHLFFIVTWYTFSMRSSGCDMS